MFWCFLGSSQLQGIQALATVLTLGVLVVYAWDTKKIARGSRHQVEALARPHLVIRLAEPNKADRNEGQGGYYLENVGTGPALNVRSPAFNQPNPTFNLPYLKPGVSESHALGRGLDGLVEFSCLSVGNVEYKFVASINNGFVTNQPSFQRL